MHTLSPHFSSCAHFLQLHSAIVCKSRLQHFVFSPPSLRSLLCAFAAQSFLTFCDWYGAVALRIATGSARKEKSSCVQTTPTLCAHHSLRGLVVTQDTHWQGPHLAPPILTEEVKTRCEASVTQMPQLCDRESWATCTRSGNQ